jgi:hypothetical protein
MEIITIPSRKVDSLGREGFAYYKSLFTQRYVIVEGVGPGDSATTDLRQHTRSYQEVLLRLLLRQGNLRTDIIYNITCITAPVEISSSVGRWFDVD